MEIFKITKSKIKWFEPIISEEMQYRLRCDKNVFAIGAVKELSACGVLVFEINENSVEIIYIAVSDKERHKGVGTRMLSFLCKYAYKSDTMVGCTFMAVDKTDPLYLFFEAQSTFTTIQTEGFVCTVTVDGLKEISFADKRKLSEMKPFFSLPLLEQKKFFFDIELKGYSLSPKGFYIKPLCLCSMTENGVNAAVFFEKGEDDSLVLSFAYSASGASGKLISLLSEDSNRITAKMRGEKKIHIAAVTSQSIAIIDKLFPNYTVTDRFFRSDWDMGE